MTRRPTSSCPDRLASTIISLTRQYTRSAPAGLRLSSENRTEYGPLCFVPGRCPKAASRVSNSSPFAFTNSRTELRISNVVRPAIFRYPKMEPQLLWRPNGGSTAIKVFSSCRTFLWISVVIFAGHAPLEHLLFCFSGTSFSIIAPTGRDRHRLGNPGCAIRSK